MQRPHYNSSHSSKYHRPHRLQQTSDQHSASTTPNSQIDRSGLSPSPTAHPKQNPQGAIGHPNTDKNEVPEDRHPHHQQDQHTSGKFRTQSTLSHTTPTHLHTHTLLPSPQVCATTTLPYTATPLPALSTTLYYPASATRASAPSALRPQILHPRHQSQPRRRPQSSTTPKPETPRPKAGTEDPQADRNQQPESQRQEASTVLFNSRDDSTSPVTPATHNVTPHSSTSAHHPRPICRVPSTSGGPPISTP